MFSACFSDPFDLGIGSKPYLKYCKVRFRRSKPFSQGITRAISLTIKADIVSRDFKGPNPFLKAFQGSFS